VLVKAQTVRRGDLIHLEVIAGAIRLQVPARAEQAGSIGDLIVCRNLDSGRRISAKLVTPKIAQVEVLR
jgi:flagella basal body P-ring formation protein FlgA